jgi:hypothetical protein
MRGVKPLKVAYLVGGICYTFSLISMIALGEGIIVSFFSSFLVAIAVVGMGWIILTVLLIAGLAVEPLIRPTVKLFKPLLKWLKS